MRWHQDIQAWPHTNFSVLTFGVYLDDTGPEQGPLTALPGTHRGPLFDQFDDGGRWTGALSARDAATLPTDTADRDVRAGRHGRAAPLPRRARLGRQLLVADAPAAPQRVRRRRRAADHAAPAPTSRTGVLVRGQEPLHVHMEPYPARLPPRWDQVGYRSIFAAQGAAAKPAYSD